MKVQANELRIGNLLQGNNCIHQVNEIKPTYYTSQYGSTLFRDAKPIPLTEEWLVKFGFELNYRSNFSINYGHIENYKFSYKFNIPENKQWLEYHGGAINCKYVHQLQNIIHALTGEELQVK